MRKILLSLLLVVLIGYAAWPVDECCCYCDDGVGSSSSRVMVWLGRERAHSKCFFEHNPVPPRHYSQRDKPNRLKEDYGWQIYPVESSKLDVQAFLNVRFAWERKRDFMLGKGVPFNHQGITLWDRIASRVY